MGRPIVLVEIESIALVGIAIEIKRARKFLESLVEPK